MPRLIAPAAGPALSLAQAVAAIEDAATDWRDEDAFAALAPVLAGLGQNRRFLGDLAIAELEACCAGQVGANAYGPQVLLLHAGRGWFLRANIWPAAGDSVVTANGEAAFFYHLPHDHNFSFLTLGYFGPGYLSDYWEYDYRAVTGAEGEPVALRPMGRHRLAPGGMMLYRAHRDVHRQLPPESLSVTLNIVESGPRQRWLDQYRFDVEAGTIAGILNPLGSATLLPLAAHLGGDGAAALLETLAARHPCDRMRFAAIAAAASAAPGLDARIAMLARGTAAPTRHVRAMSRATIQRLERARHWIRAIPSTTDRVCPEGDYAAA